MSTAAAPAPKIRTQSTFPATLTIDGIDLDVRIKRMTNTEYDEFLEGWSRWETPRGESKETPEEKATREAAIVAWMRASLDAYLTLEPGQYEHDGHPVTKGGDLLDLYPGRADVTPQALTIIKIEQALTNEEKKTYKPLLDSVFGLKIEPQTAGTGNAPAPTAASAAPSDSAPAAAATAACSCASSGMTDLSC